MLTTGTILANRYQIVGVLSDGRKSVLYSARDNTTNRFCTIKMLEGFNDRASRRFQREAHIVSKLDHPNICRCLDCGLHSDSQPFIVMEYVEGTDLEKHLATRGPQTPDWAIPVFLQICDALHYAHSANLVHRNIKPSKVMLSGNPLNPVVKLLDFGIAKPFESKDSQILDLTEPGVAVGTLLFMSPEQCQGKPLDARSDIYSLGCLMYRVLTGQHAFEAKTLPELVRKQMERTPDRLTKANPHTAIPEKLENAVLRCLDRNPKKRFSSVLELKKALAGESSERRLSPLLLAVILAVVLVSVVIIAFMWSAAR